jgi:predicted HTH domain antitoxin
MSSSRVSTHVQTHPLTVDLPKSVINLLGPTDQVAARRLAELAYVELFRQGEVSSGWAAEQLGMSKTDFLDLLFDHDVPYFDLSEEDLRQQVESAMQERDRSTS